MNESRISISKADLQNAARNGSMSPLDVEPLWQALLQNQKNVPVAEDSTATRFGIEQLAWYGGGFLVFLAMSWLAERAAESFGAGGLLALSLLYAAVFVVSGGRLIAQGIRTPGGILYTLAVGLTPVLVGSLMSVLHQDAFLGTNAGLLLISSITCVASLFALRRANTSIVTIPGYASLWAILMTLAAMLTTENYRGVLSPFPHYDQFAMLVGLAILALSVAVDSRHGRLPGRDLSWWGYVIGTASFWIPLSLMDSGGELGKLVYFIINLLMMFASIILARRVLLLAGAIGAVYYASHLLYAFFSNSVALPVALVAVGVGLIYVGNYYRRHHASIDASVLLLVPASWQRLLPKRG